jgi:hypothetical protein
MNTAEFAPPPEKRPDTYGRNAAYNQKRCSVVAQGFFKDAVRRARERNDRYIAEEPPNVVISNAQADELTG